MALIFLILFFAVVYPILTIFTASFIHPETGAFSLNRVSGKDLASSL